MKKEPWAPRKGRPILQPDQRQENFSQCGICLTSDPNTAYVADLGLGFVGEAPTFRRDG